MPKFKYVDVYAYYKNKEIVEATLVHHINEVKEDYSKRLSDDNLIAVSSKSHNEIHRRMNNGEREIVIKELKDMVKQFELEFKS